MTTPGAPVGAGADAHAGGKPDPELLAAVVAALAETMETCDGTDAPRCSNCVQVRAAAPVIAAAAGRVLAEGFKKRAAEVQVAIDNAVLAETPDLRRWIVMEETYRRAAAVVLAACGVPEGDEGGGDGDR